MLDVDKNNVEALKQVRTKVIYNFDSSIKNNILFIGNSITYHEIKEDIGWFRNCGMAASEEKYDYVHRFIDLLNKDNKRVNYAICNFSFWELEYYKEDILNDYEPLLNIKWDLVIIALNGNVKRDTLKKYDYYPYYKKLAMFFKPKANRMIFVDDFWPYIETDSVTRKVANELNETFVSISDISLVEGAEAKGLYEHPGVQLHPSDYGMELIANAIYEGYKTKEK